MLIDVDDEDDDDYDDDDDDNLRKPRHRSSVLMAGRLCMNADETWHA